MFIGHYGAALALKPVAKKVSLFWLFVAATWLDIVFDTLGLFGIEKVRIVPGFTAANALDLYYYPFSHSLLAALIWSAVGYVIVRLLPLKDRENRNRYAMVIAAAVFSHWILDYVTHIPDLSLWGGETKVGLGLWQSAEWSFLVETALFAVTLGIYLVLSAGRSFRERWGMILLCVVLFALFAMTVLHPTPPPSVSAMTIAGLMTNLLAALAAGWLSKEKAGSVQ